MFDVFRTCSFHVIAVAIWDPASHFPCRFPCCHPHRHQSSPAPSTHAGYSKTPLILALGGLGSPRNCKHILIVSMLLLELSAK